MDYIVNNVCVEVNKTETNTSALMEYQKAFVEKLVKKEEEK